MKVVVDLGTTSKSIGPIFCLCLDHFLMLVQTLPSFYPVSDIPMPAASVLPISKMVFLIVINVTTMVYIV